MHSVEQLSFPWASPPKPAQPMKSPPVLMPHPSSTYEEVLPPGTKWDFETTFPEPLPDAFIPIEDPAEMGEEAIAAVHDEHARHCLAILSDIRTVNDSIRTGVDPRTGQYPKTDKQRLRLREHLGQVATELPVEFEDMLGAYTSAFGIEAGDAFRAYLIRRDREYASDADTIAPEG